jgi:hypothetical protein
VLAARHQACGGCPPGLQKSCHQFSCRAACGGATRRPVRCCALLSQTQQQLSNSSSSSRQAICNILDVVPSMKDVTSKPTKGQRLLEVSVCRLSCVPTTPELGHALHSFRAGRCKTLRQMPLTHSSVELAKHRMVRFQGPDSLVKPNNKVSFIQQDACGSSKPRDLPFSIALHRT